MKSETTKRLTIMITRVGIQCEEKGKVNTVSVLRLVSIYSFTLRIRKFGNFIPVR